MSTYTYKCLKCLNRYDMKASIYEKENKKGKKFQCPKCHSENTRQQFSIINFVKNIFEDDNNNSCCSENSCDSTCKPKEKKNNCCN